MSTKQYLDYAGLQRLVKNIDKKYAPISAIVFKSTVDNIEALPELASVNAGWMYNVTTGGGTTTDFVEGAGHILGDGENVAAVELVTGYTAVALPQSTDDPKAEGWFVVDEASEATVSPDANPKALGLYELDGTVYVLTEDETVQVKTYYTVTFETTNDRIPLIGATYYEVNTVKKWDILGGLFDLEGKYLEFGEEFPQTPPSKMKTGRVFLYLGEDKKVYTAVASPEGRPKDEGYFEGTFVASDLIGVVNPKQVPLYEEDSAAYFATVPTTEDPATEGLYELSGAEYIPTEDTEVVEGKTYYKKVASYVRTADSTVTPEKTYYVGTFEASTDASVAADKVYYTEETLYSKAGIYKYDATEAEWIAQSTGGSGDFVPITNKEIDDLFI